MKALKDMMGQRIGRLVVFGTEKKNGFTQWRCRCDCGNETVVRGGFLRSGNTQSCGCLKREVCGEIGRLHLTTHGMYATPEWNAWAGMKRRCQNPNDKDFSTYGGRGIKICAEWQNFDRFYADMGSAPTGFSLDRIDVDGDYSPANCRWASKSVQSANQRRFQDPEAKAAWILSVREGLKRGHANLSAAQRRRWERWRAEKGV